MHTQPNKWNNSKHPRNKNFYFTRAIKIYNKIRRTCQMIHITATNNVNFNTTYPAGQGTAADGTVGDAGQYDL